MAIQFTPLAAMAAKYGAAALVGFTAARFAPRGRLPRAVEVEMDAAPRGLRLRKARGQFSGSAKWVRDFRPGPLGPRFRFDGTALMRLKVRRLT